MMLSTQLLSERNYSFDALKLLLASLVVFRHVPSAYQVSLMPITTCAVPVFFMVSGYLVYCKDVSFRRLINGAKRIVLLLLYSAVFYYLYFFLTHGYWYIPTFQDIVVFSLINDVPFAGHLWYLAAYIYVLIFIAILYKLGKSNVLNYLVPIFVVIYLAADIYYYRTNVYHSLSLVFLFRSWLFTGLPFFYAGVCLLKRPSVIPRPIVSFTCLMFFIIFALFETVFFLPEDHISDVFYTTWPVCFFLFSFFSVLPIRKNNIIARWGQKYSLYIYLFHPAVIPFIKNGIGDGLLGTWFQPFIVLIITFALSVIYVRVKEYIKDPLCKNLKKI